MDDAKEHGTVYIVDDDEPLRTALTRLCLSAGLHAVAHADAAYLLSAPVLARPSCILLDVRLRDQDGLDLQNELRSSGLTTPIIFLTGHGTIPMTVRAMREGATEFLIKPVSDDDLLCAVGRALEADRRSLHELIEKDALARRLASLTTRERDLLGLAIGGLMNKQIAAELGISEITAKVHKRRMMEKMNARSLAELVRIAHQLGLDPVRMR